VATTNGEESHHESNQTKLHKESWHSPCDHGTRRMLRVLKMPLAPNEQDERNITANKAKILVVRSCQVGLTRFSRVFSEEAGHSALSEAIEGCSNTFGSMQQLTADSNTTIDSGNHNARMEGP
jgi:hypothetical protein